MGSWRLAVTGHFYPSQRGCSCTSTPLLREETPCSPPFTHHFLVGKAAVSTEQTGVSVLAKLAMVWSVWDKPMQRISYFSMAVGEGEKHTLWHSITSELRRLLSEGIPLTIDLII